MSAKETWSDGLRRSGGDDGVLRRPDRSVDIAAYASIAHRERAAAIASSMLLAVRFIREAWATAVRRSPQQTCAVKACSDSRG
jgi:hypothetical protein